jgi:hypothetical protein
METNLGHHKHRSVKFGEDTGGQRILATEEVEFKKYLKLKSSGNCSHPKGKSKATLQAHLNPKRRHKYTILPAAR